MGAAQRGPYLVSAGCGGFEAPWWFRRPFANAHCSTDHGTLFVWGACHTRAMSVFERLERGVERAVNTPFSALKKAPVKPVELASRLRRELDDHAAVLSRERTAAPNSFTISLSPTDYAQIQSWGATTLATELAANLTEYAASQHYSFVGPVAVAFEENPQLSTGNFDVASGSSRGGITPVTSPAGESYPILDIGGQRYLLTGQVTVLGRDPDADIPIDDPGVSRKHLEIRVTPAGVIATDLGSTNGLYVEGNLVPAATLVDGNTLTIGRTRIMFWAGAPVRND